MKTDVRTLIVVDMHRYLGARLQGLAGSDLVTLKVGPNDVIGLAGGHTLREFASVLGIEFPAGFPGLVAGSSDLHLDPIERVAVWIPNRAIDQSVRFRFPGAAGPGVYRN